jgi:hypothetical protein
MLVAILECSHTGSNAGMCIGDMPALELLVQMSMSEVGSQQTDFGSQQHTPLPPMLLLDRLPLGVRGLLQDLKRFCH